MGSSYKITDEHALYFITFTVVNWIDAFTRDIFRDVFYESTNFCIKNKGLQVYAYCIMTNHIHLIVSTNKNPLSDIVRDWKAYTSGQIRLSLEETTVESRKKWMMNAFVFRGTYNSRNYDFQFWESGYQPILLDSNFKIDQRLEYIHQNPVKQGLVVEPAHWQHSSATFYNEENAFTFIPLIRIER